jgi:hypothetical protein
MNEVPEANQVLHAAAKTPEGLLLFDTCPSEEAFKAFFGSEEVQAMFAKHGLLLGAHEDYPLVAAYARGRRIDAQAWGGGE